MCVDLGGISAFQPLWKVVSTAEYRWPANPTTIRSAEAMSHVCKHQAQRA